jgi:hypothetical protein
VLKISKFSLFVSFFLSSLVFGGWRQKVAWNFFLCAHKSRAFFSRGVEKRRGEEVEIYFDILFYCLVLLFISIQILLSVCFFAGCALALRLKISIH